MDDNQDFHGTSPDLYEEILAYESLDPYEGLLNRSKSTRADLKNSAKEVSSQEHLKDWSAYCPDCKMKTIIVLIFW